MTTVKVVTKKDRKCLLQCHYNAILGQVRCFLFHSLVRTYMGLVSFSETKNYEHIQHPFSGSGLESEAIFLLFKIVTSTHTKPRQVDSSRRTHLNHWSLSNEHLKYMRIHLSRRREPEKKLKGTPNESWRYR